MSRQRQLYDSEAWLRNQYLRQKKTYQQIAKEQGVSPVTIWRRLDKFGLIRERKIKG